jgi:hypothetical protein
MINKNYKMNHEELEILKKAKEIQLKQESILAEQRKEQKRLRAIERRKELANKKNYKKSKNKKK